MCSVNLDFANRNDHPDWNWLGQAFRLFIELTAHTINAFSADLERANLPGENTNEKIIHEEILYAIKMTMAFVATIKVLTDEEFNIFITELQEGHFAESQKKHIQFLMDKVNALKN